MRSYYDDMDEFDELSFDDFAATRRIIKDKHRGSPKTSGRKKTHKVQKDQWDAAEWDEFDDYEDYQDAEFDKHYRYDE